MAGQTTPLRWLLTSACEPANSAVEKINVQTAFAPARLLTVIEPATRATEHVDVCNN